MDIASLGFGMGLLLLLAVIANRLGRIGEVAGRISVRVAQVGNSSDKTASLRWRYESLGTPVVAYGMWADAKARVSYRDGEDHVYCEELVLQCRGVSQVLAEAERQDANEDAKRQGGNQKRDQVPGYWRGSICEPPVPAAGIGPTPSAT